MPIGSVQFGWEMPSVVYIASTYTDENPLILQVHFCNGEFVGKRHCVLVWISRSLCDVVMFRVRGKRKIEL
jgi:hypothetical protein